MTLLDLNAVRASWRFPLQHAGAVIAGAAVYAVLFAAQNMLGANAGADAPSAGPLALVFGLAAFAAFIFSYAAWGRLALGRGGAGGLLGHQLGADERRLALVALLVFILVFTVVGTAFLALAFMVAALAVINVPEGAPQPDAGSVDVLSLLGPGEMAVAAVAGTAFALFSLWFTLRLVLAFPATLAANRIQVLTAWPLSGKRRAITLALTLLLAAGPGLLALAVLNLASAAVLGAWPGGATSAVEALGGPAGAGYFAVSAVHGFIKMALIGAPVAAALCALYDTFTETDANAAA